MRLPERGFPLTAIVPRVERGPVFREAKVTEMRMSGGGLQPVDARNRDAAARRDGGDVASDLRIPITPPETAELELTIDDRSNPPLALAAIEGEIAPQPANLLPEFLMVSPLRRGRATPLGARPGTTLRRSARGSRSSRPARASWGAPRGAASRPRSETVDLSIPAGAKVDADAFPLVAPD